ncbi:class I SAM-dependent methyltransferase [Amylibacter sp.]|nr:class I SAM-dependent methyltransferase [Amylibacter sp.]
MENNDWWMPKNLKKLEKKYQEEIDLETIDVRNDFGSYKIMLAKNDPAKSLIHAHNDITPNYRVKIMKKILGDFNPQKIYDVGCGLGFTTDEISKEYPFAEVIGMDISKDAVAYGKKNFPNCQFLAEAVDPENGKQFLGADLICAFEFYPFTRTNNFIDHRQYISYLTDEISENGKLVIFQYWDNSESLSENYKDIVSSFTHLKFELYKMPIKKIGKFVPSMFFANLLSEIARLILRGVIGRPIGKNKFLVISKN